MWRELIRIVPFGPGLTALMWNQSHALEAEAGRGAWLSAKEAWSALFQVNRTLPVLMSISWAIPLVTVWSAAPPIDVRFAVLVCVAVIQAVPWGDPELVSVEEIARARLHRRDLLEVIVEDVVGAGVAARRTQRALPRAGHAECHDRLTLVPLDTEVCVGIARGRLG